MDAPSASKTDLDACTATHGTDKDDDEEEKEEDYLIAVVILSILCASLLGILLYREFPRPKEAGTGLRESCLETPLHS